MFRKVSAGVDGWGRPGRYFVHVVAGPRTELGTRRIVRWHRSRFWREDAEQSAPFQLNRARADDFDDLLADNAGNSGAESLAADMLAALLRGQAENRRIAVAADPALIAYATERVIGALPPCGSESLTLSTFETKTSASLFAIAGVADTDAYDPGAVTVRWSPAQAAAAATALDPEPASDSFGRTARGLLQPGGPSEELAAALTIGTEGGVFNAVALVAAYEALLALAAGQTSTIVQIEALLAHPVSARLTLANVSARREIALGAAVVRPGLMMRLGAVAGHVDPAHLHDVARQTAEQLLRSASVSYQYPWRTFLEGADSAGDWLRDEIASALLDLCCVAETATALGPEACRWIARRVPLHAANRHQCVLVAGGDDAAFLSLLLRTDAPQGLAAALVAARLGSLGLDELAADACRTLPPAELAVVLRTCDESEPELAAAVWVHTAATAEPSTLKSVAYRLARDSCSQVLIAAVCAGPAPDGLCALAWASTVLAAYGPEPLAVPSGGVLAVVRTALDRRVDEFTVTGEWAIMLSSAELFTVARLGPAAGRPLTSMLLVCNEPMAVLERIANENLIAYYRDEVDDRLTEFVFTLVLRCAPASAEYWTALLGDQRRCDLLSQTVLMLRAARRLRPTRFSRRATQAVVVMVLTMAAAGSLPERRRRLTNPTHDELLRLLKGLTPVELGELDRQMARHEALQDRWNDLYDQLVQSPGPFVKLRSWVRR